MSTKIKHVSVDLETWGTEPGCDIRSIGAVLFDPDNGVVPEPDESVSVGKNIIGHRSMFYAACMNPRIPRREASKSEIGELCENTPLDSINYSRKYPLARSQQTIDFWNRPENKAASEALSSDRMDLKQALILFSDFILDISDDIVDGQVRDIQTWTHGSAFDPPILQAAFKACGLEYPLFYRAPRDTRTVFDDSGISDHSQHLLKHRYGILHHSLHDAITQARAVSESKMIINNALSALRLVPNLTREIVDLKYMNHAIRELLGPKGLEVVKMWDDKRVMRVHTSWGPNAMTMSGEERAEMILEFELAPKMLATNID